jgi:plastocyanin
MPEDVEVQLVKKDERPSFRNAHAPGISWLIVILLLVLSAFSVIHFGNLQPAVSSLPTTSADQTALMTNSPRIYTISYDTGVFSPTNLRIHAGDTVRFKNDSIFPIRIVSDDIVGFDSVGDVPQGSYFSFTFAARGTFGYHNSRNTSQAGSIIVR